MFSDLKNMAVMNKAVVIGSHHLIHFVFSSSLLLVSKEL